MTKIRCLSHFLFFGLIHLASAQDFSPPATSQTAVNRDLERAADKLYLEIETTFAAGKYWESARDLIILIDFHPNYTEMDKVVIMLGDCLYEIGCLDGATKMYKHLVKKYIRSSYMSDALLGLQRIEYDGGDFDRCIEFHKAIMRGMPSREVIDGSSYYAGLSYYKFKDYPRAINVLSNISDTSPYYDYGLYYIGLSKLRLKRVREALRTLHAVCRLPIINDERRSVIDETRLTLGYIYYELGYFNYAYKQFMRVSPKFENHKDALLAAGWAATKMEKYEDAVGPLTDIITLLPQNQNTEEAFFLLGRSYLKLGMYDEALKVYDHLLSIFPKTEFAPTVEKDVNQSLAVERQSLEEIKMELLVLESKLLEIIPIGLEEQVPTYIKKEKDKIAQIREGLLRRIYEERQTFNLLSAQMQELEESINQRRNRRDWRAFAEYGRSRVLFLKQKPVVHYEETN